MTWDVPTDQDCPECGQTMFKRSGRGAMKPFCINPECKNFLPEDKRGYRKKPAAAENAEAGTEEANLPPEPVTADAAAEEKPAKKTTKKATEKKPAAKKTTAKKPAAKKTATAKKAAAKTTKKAAADDTAQEAPRKAPARRTKKEETT